MSFAAVDIGNTSISLLIWDSEGNVKFRRHGAFRSVTDIIPFFRETGVDRVAYSTTRDLTAEESALTRANGWWEVAPEVSLPVKIGYATPETLGLDRLMGAAASTVLYPGEGVLIADAGTALTLDVVTAEGVFLGGNISAGLSMRVEALHRFTSRLPKTDTLVCDYGHIGTSTATALQYGALWGVAYEIAGNMAYSTRTYGCRRLVLTGGDGPFLFKYVSEAVFMLVAQPVEVTLNSELVVFGLKTAYEYNHDK